MLKLNKPMSLLYLLALKADWVGRSELGFLYFPDVEEKLALNNMRSIIFRAKAYDWAELELEKQRIRWLVDSDVQAFRKAIASKDYQAALALYSGDLLKDLSIRDAPEFDLWLNQERRSLATMWQQAALYVAKEYEAKANVAEAAELYQSLLSADPLSDEALLGLMRIKQVADKRTEALEAYERFCQKLDEELGIAPAQEIQALASNIRQEAGLPPLSLQREARLLKDLSKNSRDVFLALSLQQKPNLTVLRHALKLGLSELSEATEALLQGALIDTEAAVLAIDQAHIFLSEHPKDHHFLLLALARASKPEQAFELYKQVYDLTQGFGGVGDLPRVRAAYLFEAQKHMAALSYAKAADLLAELRQVEEMLEVEPDAQTRFTEAYALERQGKFKAALGVLLMLAEDAYTPNTEALASVLYWRTGKTDKASQMAQKALNSGLDWLWARATASNTLGYLAFAKEAFLEAASQFKKAASLYQAASEKQRWVGSLNNYAIALGRIAEEALEQDKDAELVAELFTDAEKAYLGTLKALEKTGENHSLQALILLNLGILHERKGELLRADDFKLQALPFAEKAKALDVQARIHLSLGNSYLNQQRLEDARQEFQDCIAVAVDAGEYFIQGMAAANLAELDRDPDAFEVALELLEQSGNQDRLSYFQAEYERTLKFRLTEALRDKNGQKAQALFKKMGELYEKLKQSPKLSKVKDALKTLEQSTDLEKNREMLLALVDARSDQFSEGLS